ETDGGVVADEVGLARGTLGTLEQSGAGENVRVDAVGDVDGVGEGIAGAHALEALPAGDEAGEEVAIAGPPEQMRPEGDRGHALVVEHLPLGEGLRAGVVGEEAGSVGEALVGALDRAAVEDHARGARVYEGAYPG